jgi:hypothetical protein
LGTPQKCADFMTGEFDKITEILSNHPSMIRQEAFFRLRDARHNEAAAAERIESAKAEPGKLAKQSVKFVEVSPEAKSEKPRRTCSSFLGGQLGATRKDGRPYSCNYGKECTFAHVSIAGKSKERLGDLVSTMMPSVKADLTRAILSRK